MSPRALGLLAGLLVSTLAHADSTKADFAAGLRIDEKVIIDVQLFALEGGGDYARAIVGRFKQGDLTIGGVAIIYCDKKNCWVNHAWLRGADEIKTLGLVDLGGQPAKFPTAARGTYERKLALAGKPTWPALLVETTTREHTKTGSRYGGEVEGEHRRSELHVISLLRKDERSPVVLDEVSDEHWPTGAGVHVTFEVVGAGKIDATEQRDIENVSACLRPEPTTSHYTLDENRRFRRAADLGRHGCS